MEELQLSNNKKKKSNNIEEEEEEDQNCTNNGCKTLVNVFNPSFVGSWLYGLAYLQAKSCTNCEREFKKNNENGSIKKVRCLNCGDVVCASCAHHSVPLETYHTSSGHKRNSKKLLKRVCDHCYQRVKSGRIKVIKELGTTASGRRISPSYENGLDDGLEYNIDGDFDNNEWMPDDGDSDAGYIGMGDDDSEKLARGRTHSVNTKNRISKRRLNLRALTLENYSNFFKSVQPNALSKRLTEGFKTRNKAISKERKEELDPKPSTARKIRKLFFVLDIYIYIYYIYIFNGTSHYLLFCYF